MLVFIFTERLWSGSVRDSHLTILYWKSSIWPGEMLQLGNSLPYMQKKVYLVLQHPRKCCAQWHLLVNSADEAKAERFTDQPI